MFAHKKSVSSVSLDASFSSFDNSVDLNSTGDSAIYPNLSGFKEYRNVSQLDPEKIDGSGDHECYSTEETSSVSSEGERSPKSGHSDELVGVTLRSGLELSPVKGRSGIHGEEMTTQRKHRSRKKKGQHMEKERHVPNQLKPPSVPWWCYHIDSVVALIIFIVLCVTIFSEIQQEQKIEPVKIKDERVVIVARFKTLFAELRTEFPSQSGRFWRILQAATQSMLSKPHPIHPAVILLASDKASIAAASCIARRFGAIVAQSYINATHQPTLVDCASFVDQQAEEFKLRLHDALEAELAQGSKVAVVENLQMMPGGASVLFHGYCDNENAPYLDATYVLTLHMFDVVNDKPDDAVVEVFLDRMWGRDVERENLAALYSRIANNIAFVNAEGPDLIGRRCP